MSGIRPAATAAALLILAPAVARAEPFHMAHANLDEQGARADLISDLEARTEADGSRSILVTKVVLALGDPDGGGPAVAASLDQTRLAFDCQAKTYKVLSQVLYAAIDPSAKQTDTSPPAGQAPRPVEGDDLQDLSQFACTGPRSVKRPMLGFQQQNLWAAIAQTADNLSRALTRAMRAGPPGGG